MFGVASEQTSGGGKRAVVANGSEGIAKFATLRDGVADTVGRQQWKIQGTGESDGGAIARFFLALEMTLQFDVDVARAEDADELIDLASSFLDPTLLQSCGEEAFVSASEADQAMRVLFEFFRADGALAFFGAQLHFGDQAAEILVAGAGRNEKRKTEFTTEARRR